MTTLARTWWLMALTLVASMSKAALAQTLEPRSYSASPVGTTFVLVGFGRSSGDVAVDPTIPITNVNATVYIPVAGVGQTFPFFGRQALLTVPQAYAWGHVSGQVSEQPSRISRSGLANTKIRFSVNLRGSPAMSVKEFFRQAHHDFIIGTSLTIDAPSGQYSGTKLVNLGTNRWAFKPEIGVSWPLKKIDLDLYASAWLYTKNPNFYPGGLVRTQEPLTALQTHISYAVRPHLWVAVDATWFGGGATTVGNAAPSPRQSNTRLGATLSLPVATNQSIKIAYSAGVTGRIGANFTTISIGWQRLWFDHR